MVARDFRPPPPYSCVAVGFRGFFGGFSAFLPVPPLNLARLFEKLDFFQKSPRKSARGTGAVTEPMGLQRLNPPPWLPSSMHA